MSPDASPQATPPPAPAPPGREPEPMPTMSFLEHLQELRMAFIAMAVVAFLAVSGAWFVSEPLLALLVTPELGQVHYFGPTEGFLIRFKISVVAGLMACFPILVWRLWQFVSPGLFRRERRTVVPVLISGTALFYAGVGFGYVAVVPKMVDFFLSFAGESLQPMINVTQYFNFVARFCLAFGIVFQLPVVIVLLAALGIVSPGRMWRTWRYGIVLIFVFAAWLTPPDAMSQIMLAVPVVVLYLLSMLLALVFARRRKKPAS